jgi:hypothetical protein
MAREWLLPGRRWVNIQGGRWHAQEDRTGTETTVMTSYTRDHQSIIIVYMTKHHKQ